ncbi:MAG TPA: hypothetical protein DET40_25470 [Lentisphaeria bacterium]|nr:MAG: hypothetical protein A2X45_18495 [Lentisphaerae bacterium GWF2_50_93]HCE46911.1 hypothetical protein [Lentisphaeria bacterium]
MLLRIRSYALHHLDKVDPRTVTSLLNLDLLDAQVQPIGGNVDLAILRDPDHPAREKIPPGPLFLYQTQEEKPKRMVVELSVLLYFEASDISRTALTELERLISGGKLEITPKTRKIFDDNRSSLLSDIPHERRKAAIDVNDAMHDDIFIAMQGLRQCLECSPPIQGSLDNFAPMIFHPTISSLDSVVLAPGNPEGEHTKLTEIIQSVVGNADNLRDVCSGYHAVLGYLPLAPVYSMGAAVSLWLEKHPSDTDNVWSAVWDCANNSPGPLPKYHACTVFILHPELVPNGKLSDLWAAILDVADISGKDEAKDIKREPWLLRKDLSRHFSHHLEAHMPDGPGANISNFAWWLAEKLASLLPDDPKSIQYYRKEWVERSAEVSVSTWFSACPRVGYSYLRYATNSLTAPWGTGLIALMGTKLEQLDPVGQSKDVQEKFNNTLISHLLASIPFAVDAPASPTFSMECAIGETALKWGRYRPENQASMLTQLVNGNRKLSTVESLCNALREMANSPLGDQAMIAMVLKAKAYTAPDLPKPAWEVLSDNDWRKRILGEMIVEVQGNLIEAFNILQPIAQDKWFTLFPHYVADLCEQTGDADRRKILFRYVIHASLASDTVSAVRRLLHGPNRANYIGLVKEYREIIDTLWPYYPPWGQGRMRAMLANLHVT